MKDPRKNDDPKTALHCRFTRWLLLALISVSTTAQLDANPEAKQDVPAGLAAKDRDFRRECVEIMDSYDGDIDPALMEVIAKWIDTDPKESATWTLSYLHHHHNWAPLKIVAETWSQKKPAQANAWFKQVAKQIKCIRPGCKCVEGGILSARARGWAHQEPRQATSWALSQPAWMGQDPLAEALRVWTSEDAPAAYEFTLKLENPAQREKAVSIVEAIVRDLLPQKSEAEQTEER